MPKENIEGFDFTKDFTEQQVYDMLKGEILSASKRSYGGWINEEDVRVKFVGDCLFYEVNSKLYSAMKFDLDIKTNQGWRRNVAVVTPFNCYWYRYGDQINYSNDKHIELTRTHRNFMKAQYGKVWSDACKSYLADVRDMRKDLETDLFNHRVKCIENDYKRDVDIVDL